MHERFREFAHKVAKSVGTEAAFLIAVGVVVAWAVVGPIFGFSDTWQLVINTSTTIVTFLMVFLIQSTQNRDARALQLKLDELIRAQKNARDVIADLEDATEEELDDFERQFRQLRARSRRGRGGRQISQARRMKPREHDFRH